MRLIPGAEVVTQNFRQRRSVQGRPCETWSFESCTDGADHVYFSRDHGYCHIDRFGHFRFRIAEISARIRARNTLSRDTPKILISVKYSRATISFNSASLCREKHRPRKTLFKTSDLENMLSGYHSRRRRSSILVIGISQRLLGYLVSAD